MEYLRTNFPEAAPPVEDDVDRFAWTEGTGWKRTFYEPNQTALQQYILDLGIGPLFDRVLAATLLEQPANPVRAGSPNRPRPPLTRHVPLDPWDAT